MPSFALPSPGPAGQAYQFCTMPAQGTTPTKLFIKNSTAAYVYDGSTVTKVTDVDYPALTVYGCAYLDGTIYVMDPLGQVWGCDLMNPLSWTALNFISANSEGDKPIALVRHLNYILAFKERSTEILYDAGNAAPGSPLGKMVTSMMEVGCAVGGSIAFTDNTVYFMSTAQQKGRSISRMDGFQPQKVSTPFVDRLLNADDLSGVYAYVVKSNGHIFYVLTLVKTGVTLVYDEITQQWHTWTNTTRGVDTACTTSTDATTGITTVTVTGSNPVVQTLLPAVMYRMLYQGHNLNDGDPVLIGGQQLPITYINPTQFSVISPTTLPATTSYVPYMESNFPPMFYTRGANVDYLLRVSDGYLFAFDPSTYQDNGQPINTKIRTMVEDWGVMALKLFRRVELVGDLSTTMVQVRVSDDDYQTYSQYRPILVQDNRAQLRALGAARRRVHEIRHFDNTPLRLLSIEVDFDIGAR